MDFFGMYSRAFGVYDDNTEPFVVVYSYYYHDGGGAPVSYSTRMF